MKCGKRLSRKLVDCVGRWARSWWILLIFYLLVNKDDIPIIIDQPEENLGNQTVFKVLVKCIKEAKDWRQAIMVTYNPSLTVVCDA